MNSNKDRMERIIEKAKESFYTELKDKLTTITDILMRDDVIESEGREELKSFFHSLKGTAGTLGLVELAEIGMNGEELLNNEEEEADKIRISFYIWNIKEKLIEYEKMPKGLAGSNDDVVYVNMENRGSVLIIDDDPITLGLLEEALEDEGYKVGILDSPMEIEHALDKSRPDIILLDIVMPNMDGYAALEIISNKYEDVPVVFLTGRSGIDDRIKGLRAGAEDYIIKPFDIRELITRVEFILKRYNRLKEKLIYDQLTGAYTRQYLNERLKEEFARYERNGRPFSVAFLDIDRFKDINDTYGHAAGDYVLQRFAGTVMESMRQSDGLYRYGGEEFVLLMPDTDEEEAMLAIERIRSLFVGKIFNFDGNDISIRFSAGIKEADMEIEDPQEIVKYADKAMYVAKETGSDRLVLYSLLNNKDFIKRKKIMIVDDERVIAMLIKAATSDMGVDVVTAGDGNEALKIATKETPNLVILDLMLPKMSGFEVLKKLKSNLNTKNIKVIVVSSKEQDDDIAKVFEMGADDYVRKPFSVSELKMRIINQLKRI